MLNQYSRTVLLIGKDNLKKLWDSRVAIFGIGGVGGSVVESLARIGVGHFDLIDDDLVCLTNLNRQVLATRQTYGKYKVDVAEERIHDINPKIEVKTYKTFYLPDKKNQFDFRQYDYVVDCVDTVTAKIDIIMEALRLHVPVISAMGCGNRLDPTQLRLGDLAETKGDPLSKVMRRELRRRGVYHLPVIYSTEPPIRPDAQNKDDSCVYHCVCPPGTKRKCTERRDIPGSTTFVPNAAGILVAYQISKDIMKKELRFDIPEDDLKNIKMVFCDLDGTLLNSQSRLSSGTIQAVKSFKDHIPFILCSGRNFTGMEKIYESLELNTPLITTNGAYVFQGDKVLENHCISKDVVQSLLDVLKDYNVSINLYCGKEWYTKDLSHPALKREIHAVGRKPTNTTNIEDVSSLSVNKILLIGEEKEITRTREKLDTLTLDFTLAQNNPFFLELCPKGFDKGTAISSILKENHLTLDQCLVIGDNQVDIPMFRLAKYKASPKNAIKEIQRLSNIHLASHENDGVAELLEYWLRKNLF